ncbi:MAG: FAD binding domain-containing protein [Desulfomonile tiedjei]|nr:FAD binding domain-containing protein [Desulfomonile tiedjei]
MRLPAFAYHAPGSLAEALRIKNELGTSASILAGGTELIVNLKQRLSSPAAVISLKNIKEMSGIEAKPDAVVVKAGTSLMETADNEAIKKHFPLLVKAIGSIGAIGIQHFRGTIGGNLCLQPRCILYNQSLFWRSGKDKCHRTGGKDCLALKGSESCNSVCSADTVPVLVALSAQLTIAGIGGKRSMPVSEFFTAKGESPFNLAPEEIVTEIRLPIPWAPISGSYQRLSFRSAVDFPTVNAAAVAIMDKGRVESFRVVLSAAGPAPIILKEAESVIKGQTPDLEMIELAGNIALKAAEGAIVDNAAASKDYRIKMAAVTVRRAVKEALGL